MDELPLRLFSGATEHCSAVARVCDVDLLVVQCDRKASRSAEDVVLFQIGVQFLECLNVRSLGYMQIIQKRRAKQKQNKKQKKATENSKTKSNSKTNSKLETETEPNTNTNTIIRINKKRRKKNDKKKTKTKTKRNETISETET
jgi:hypothetical protein